MSVPCNNPVGSTHQHCWKIPKRKLTCKKSKKKPLIIEFITFTSGVFCHYITCLMYFLWEILPSQIICLKGVPERVFKSLKISLLGYRIINMEHFQTCPALMCNLDTPIIGIFANCLLPLNICKGESRCVSTLSTFMRLHDNQFRLSFNICTLQRRIQNQFQMFQVLLDPPLKGIYNVYGNELIKSTKKML